MFLQIHTSRFEAIIITVILSTTAAVALATGTRLLTSQPNTSLGFTDLDKTGTTGVRQNAKGPQTLFFSRFAGHVSFGAESLGFGGDENRVFKELECRLNVLILRDLLANNPSRGWLNLTLSYANSLLKMVFRMTMLTIRQRY